MFLFPYRAQIKLHKIPIATIAVAIACLLIYFLQQRNEARVAVHAKNTCAQLAASSEGGSAAEGYRVGKSDLSCEQAVLHIYFDPDPEKHLVWHADDMIRAVDASAAERLRMQYRAFAEHAPVFLTARLWHDRSRFDPVGMLTSSFAHVSWEHVIFNLIFFFAFAAAVELILGPVLFLGAIIGLSFGIGMFDTAISRWADDLDPTLGLSGVVMGMLALFVYFLPHAKIRFAFWFLLSAGTFAVPAWFVAIWYVAWNLFYQMSQPQSGINFVAHLSGAAFGLAIGLVFFRAKRSWAKELVLEKVDLTQEETWLTKLNFIAASSAILPLFVIATFVLVTAVVLFVKNFGVQLLLISPAIAAGYQIYRSRQADRPKRERYQLGIEAIDRHEYEQALKHLEPLAQANDTRALYALAQLYAAGSGVLRDESKAVELYARAAERGHTAARYALGAMYADGRGVPRNSVKAIDCYEKAAEAGMPEAANSLAYIYENGIGISADREKAIEWYYRAAVKYQQTKRLDDAQAIIHHLESVAARYPAVLGLVTKLKTLVTVRRS
jgi:membrane associated rhomboid family serine protease